jgi:hypothetical protein
MSQNNQTPRPSLLHRVLVGNVESSPLRRVLGDQPLGDIFGERPFSDRNAPGREADRALNGDDRG